jgi:hypothetical protein
MTTNPSIARTLPPGDRYVLLLYWVLMGYALFGKGFAYFGYQPIFISEFTFIAGLLALLRSGCLVALLASAPCLLLATTMSWTPSRTLPFVDVYGVEALRDSVIIIYGGFAFIVAALLIEDHRRIATIVRYYRTFEAPMLGIWFWSLIGFGIGTTMIYRYMEGRDPWRATSNREPLPACAR